jgi:A/G-specific adenine glycosylase
MTVAARSRQKKALPPADPAVLLAWYDRHRRKLPWRALPGVAADPYRVWLSEIMLQQTTVKAVAPYFLRFVALWPTVSALADAALDDVLRQWAGLGYYARARNLHACAKVVATEHGGVFPSREAALRTLPGIGPYTAAAIAAIAFDVPATPVDGNIERVVTRLFAVADELPAAKAEIARLAATLTPTTRPGDFAQAMMDLGATICTPKNPACALCPWNDSCVARAQGNPESFPRKAEKTTGTLRRGVAFVVRRSDGALLARTRAPQGLLGGMTEVPTSPWTPDFDDDTALMHAPLPREIQWRRIAGVVTHTFTHFPLELVVYTTEVGTRTRAPAGMRWVEAMDIAGEAFPNVMRKVIAHAGASSSKIGRTTGRTS